MPLATALRWGTFIVFSFLVLSPVIKILRRTGYSEWWALLMFAPGVNIVALWLFAYDGFAIPSEPRRPADFIACHGPEPVLPTRPGQLAAACALGSGTLSRRVTNSSAAVG